MYNKGISRLFESVALHGKMFLVRIIEIKKYDFLRLG